MKVTVAELERLNWKRKKRRYAVIPEMLQAYLITELGQLPPDPPPITRILGTCVYHDDELVTILESHVGTEIKMAIREWVDRTHGGGMGRLTGKLLSFSGMETIFGWSHSEACPLGEEGWTKSAILPPLCVALE